MVETESRAGDLADAPVVSTQDRWKRWAPVGLFAAVEVSALVFWLHAGRHEWFYRDEWDFLARRKATRVGDLLRPHNEHCVTIPVLVYRSLWWAFGLRTYSPYRLVIVVLYLSTAAMLFVVIRRAGVHPWIAFAAASAYGLFGAGWENVIKPFQMTFTGAVFFGLVSLVLADHDGAWKRRDWLALAAGLASLMMSGISATMIAAVGLAVLLRRGWRIALRLVGPLIAVFLVWWLAYGHSGSVRKVGAIPSPTLRSDGHFVAHGYERAFHDLGHFGDLGWVLLAVLLVGAPIAWIERRRRAEIARLAVPAALLAGSLVFLVTTARSRSSLAIPDYAGTSRYVSLTVAMVLPAFAVAADALARRRPLLVPVTMVMLLAGIPGSLHNVENGQRQLRSRYSFTRATMLSLPRDPLAKGVPRSLRPEQFSARDVTVGWLLDAAKEHRVPASPRISDALASSHFRLAFYQLDGPTPTAGCATVAGPMSTTVRVGEVLGVFDNPIKIVPLTRPALVGFAPFFVPSEGHAIQVLRAVRPVVLYPYSSGPARVCVPPGAPMPHPYAPGKTPNEIGGATPTSASS